MLNLNDVLLFVKIMTQARALKFKVNISSNKMKLHKLAAASHFFYQHLSMQLLHSILSSALAGAGLRLQILK
ncbi:hypothetical protein BEI67_19140 [Photobacterium damselae subsp. piscicida]|nr:hypothetical protein BEI67_19140 [Photobacterium damselae subsp. piscicida]PSV77722.1 hypothetical protein CTT35_05695 [Photobacterium damselae]PSW79922.1 hypothetical protein CTT37_06170 [Photobacterium damselae]